MRQIALLALLLAFAAAVYGQENILEKGLEGRSAADVISGAQSAVLLLDTDECGNAAHDQQIGRASCRERVCLYV